MVTKRKPSIYDCIAGSPILSRGETLVPFCCFPEHIDWSEIVKEMDLIKQKYGIFFPEWDNRKHGWQWIYTLKEGKKRVWIE